METHEHIIRYELTFDGERQYIGVCNGVYEALSENRAAYYDERFCALIPIPHIGQRCTFFFTEEGDALVRPLLRELDDELLGSGLWRVVRAEMQRMVSVPLYEDELQLAYPEDEANAALDRALWHEIRLEGTKC